MSNLNQGPNMAKRNIELWDTIEDHDAERAASLLNSPTSKKLTQCLNGYRAATREKKRRRRTALLCALCLIEREIGRDEILRAINFMTGDEADLATNGEVDEEFVNDLALVLKADARGKRFMGQIVQSLKSTAHTDDELKNARKFEVRLAIEGHKPRPDVPFTISWC